MDVTISSLFEFTGFVSYTLVLAIIVTSKNTSFKSAFYTIFFSTGKIYKECKVLITDSKIEQRFDSFIYIAIVTNEKMNVF